MKLFGLAGWSGSGKTTLIERVLPHLTARGLTVSTVKHAHHGFDLDRPGKDSYRHRQAGAREVMLASDGRFVLLSETAPPDLDALIARMSPVDLILIEGFGAGAHPKIEVHRPALGKTPLWPGRTDIAAIATDDQAALPVLDLPVLDLNDATAIAGFIATYTGLD